MACYYYQENAEEEWAALPPVDRKGPIILKQRWEIILDEMYAWYEARCEDEPLHVVFRHLQHTLFKNVTKRLVEDVCISGASQPIVIGEAKPFAPF